VSQVVHVETSKLGMLIGKQGATVNHITRKHGCRIDIAQDRSAATSAVHIHAPNASVLAKVIADIHSVVG
jgi:polyribonucleotide nucleotidyltransferase